MKLRELADKIAQISTVSNIDTMAVLEALLQIIPERLKEGNIIRLGDLGSFFTTITTDGVTNKADFSSKNIKNASIKFRPGVLVKNALSSAKYEKIG